MPLTALTALVMGPSTASLSQSPQPQPSRTATSPEETTTPVRTLVHSWILYIMLPAAVIAWYNTKRWSAVLGAALATPALAILQGAFGILSYRIYFRDAPIPLTPSHGVVAVYPAIKKPVKPEAEAEQDSNSNSISQLQPQQPQHAANDFLERAAAQERPLRLLVIGDSLAIGVGQASRGTPIMPEVISKTLSKKMNGRVVYWTCHGAPGASAGWIVRELERGVDYLNNNNSGDNDDDDDDNDGWDDGEFESMPGSSCSETDESSSDESSTEDVYVASGKTAVAVAAAPDTTTSTTTTTASQSKRMSRKVWRQRLTQHRKRSEPEFLGPYDIAVVLTGSNDLKSAFFPFLLTGEDVEFRRQAVARGGSYPKELRILLETLNSKMQMQLKNLRYSVEAATDSVRERVGDTIERLAPGTGVGNRIRHHRDSSGTVSTGVGASNPSGEEHDHEHDDHADHRHFPLVVLPGMPARALPKFQKLPLRWLAVPVVDIMDQHKRNLSKSHPGQVLFVPAPSLEEIEKYENKEGDIWKQKCSEDTALNVRDVKSRDRHRIEGEMRKYYQGKAPSPDDRQWMPFSSPLPPAVGSKIFSVDRIHPNDQGYDFWGRYIGNSIYDEWQKKQKQL